MTPSTKPVTRETSAIVRDRGARNVIATIEHGLLILRAKGLRTRETLDIGVLYQQAVKSRVWREKMEQAKQRKASGRGARRSRK